MNPVSKLFPALVVTSLLSGCVVIGGQHSWNDDWIEEQRRNSERINQLEIGMQRTDVMDRLGSPNFSEAYTREDDEYRVLFYRTQRRHADGETTRDETTPLVFRNNVLLGWGQDVYVSVK